MKALEAVRRWDERIAVRTVTLVSTMGCFWLFFLWSLLPLVWDGVRDTVFYVSGGILQLILLPLIMVGQVILSRDSDQRAREDHAALMEELADMRKLMTEEDEELELLRAIAERVSVVQPGS